MDEITLFQIKPKHIAIAFAEIYTSDHMLKGQKELANCIATIIKEEGIRYGVKKRSEPIFYYGNETDQYIEDPDCSILLSLFVPILKEQMATFRYCMMSSSVPDKEAAWRGFLDNLSVIDNGSEFQKQLRLVLPILKNKTYIDSEPNEMLIQKMTVCREKYNTLKSSISEINPNEVYTEKYVDCTPRMIGGVPLGKLYHFYHQYQENKEYKIPFLLRHVIEKQPEIEKEWEAYIKYGLYQGKNIIEDDE